MRLIPVLALSLMAAPPLVAQEFLTFKSPSGNILCALYDDSDPGARCDMSELTPSYTQPPAECEFDWGASFAIGAGAAEGELACVSDAIANPNETPVLPYGATVSFGGVSCRSAETGITCVNNAGHGFALAKKKQRLF